MSIAVTQFVAAAPPASHGASTTPEASGELSGEGFADILLEQIPPQLIAAQTVHAGDGSADKLFEQIPPVVLETQAGVAGESLANILLGQMTTQPDATQAADEPTTESTPPTPTDPAQLFAALGLPFPAATGTPPVDEGAAGSQGTTSTPAIWALSAAPGSAAARPDQAAGLPGFASSADGLRQDASLTDSTQPFLAAKLAGTDLPQGTLVTNPDLPGANPNGLTAQTVAAAHTSAQSASSSTSTLQLSTPLRDAAWPADFAQKVTWLARQDLQSAQITLNPPQLGPIEISLDLKNDQATAVFVSASAEVREAIESAVPRLREMLAGVGVELGQTSVSHESFRNHSENARTGSGTLARDGAGETAGNGRQAGIATLARPAGSGRGLVDTFA